MALNDSDRFLGIANDYIDDATSPEFTPDAAERVRAFIRGVDGRPQLLVDEEAFRRAEVATRTLMMQIASTARPDEIVDEAAVAVAIRGLCPGFFPFC